MTPEEARETQRRIDATKGTFRKKLLNENRCPLPGAEPQQTVRDEPLGPSARAAGGGKRYAVRVVSYRVRLCDPDNLCAKSFVDCLRYAGIIPDDTAAIMDYSVSQQKVAAKTEERTEIEVTEL